MRRFASSANSARIGASMHIAVDRRRQAKNVQRSRTGGSTPSFMGPRSFVMSQDQTWLGNTDRQKDRLFVVSGGGADQRRSRSSACGPTRMRYMVRTESQVLTRVQQRRVDLRRGLVHESLRRSRCRAPSGAPSAPGLAVMTRSAR